MGVLSLGGKKRRISNTLWCTSHEQNKTIARIAVCRMDRLARATSISHCIMTCMCMWHAVSAHLSSAIRNIRTYTYIHTHDHAAFACVVHLDESNHLLCENSRTYIHTYIQAFQHPCKRAFSSEQQVCEQCANEPFVHCETSDSASPPTA